MELPLTRSLNSSSSESSIDSGFESPLGKGSGSPVSRVSNASLSDAISTTSTLTNMLVRSWFCAWVVVMIRSVPCGCMLSVESLNVHAIVKQPPVYGDSNWQLQGSTPRKPFSVVLYCNYVL